MMKSFALIWNETQDYVNLLKETEQYFNIDFHSISPNHASGINNEMHFMLDVSPNKMHFMFPRNTEEETFSHALKHIKEFTETQFENKTVGIKYYDYFNDKNKLHIERVKTVVL